mmetsp:Transcript_5527/g.15640  ORF Transcript_5527/g.15640 Transcript_5527/m.15640 type:complete len:226 (+) Transcript_5527:2751-3428(+)
MVVSPVHEQHLIHRKRVRLDGDGDSICTLVSRIVLCGVILDQRLGVAGCVDDKRASDPAAVRADDNALIVRQIVTACHFRVVELDAGLDAPLQKFPLQLWPVDARVRPRQCALLLAVQPNGGRLPDCIKAIIQSHGLKLVDPNAIVVHPNAQGVGSHNGHPVPSRSDPGCHRKTRRTRPSNHQIIRIAVERLERTLEIREPLFVVHSGDRGRRLQHGLPARRAEP